MKVCISCGREVKDFVEFPCPNCGKMIIRCNICRENKNPYRCECGFEGP